MLRLALRLSLAASLFTAVYLGVSHLFLSSSNGEGVQIFHWFVREVRRSEALNLRGVEVARSLEAKQAITDELLTGRVTLREAVEQFRAAASRIEANREGLVASYRTPENERGMCQQVLVWAKVALDQRGDPRAARRMMHRLRREMSRQYPSATAIS